VSHVWPIRRRVRYISCWPWDLLDDDQEVGDGSILANLFDVISLCQWAVQSLKVC